MVQTSNSDPPGESVQVIVMYVITGSGLSQAIQLSRHLPHHFVQFLMAVRRLNNRCIEKAQRQTQMPYTFVTFSFNFLHEAVERATFVQDTASRADVNVPTLLLRSFFRAATSWRHPSSTAWSFPTLRSARRLRRPKSFKLCIGSVCTRPHVEKSASTSALCHYPQTGSYL
jgi:hypothetical protein